MHNVNFRGIISEYTNRVLGVIKEKYGLKDKSEALDKFAELYGEKFVEPEIRKELIEEVLETAKEAREEHPDRRMSLKELKKLSGA